MENYDAYPVGQTLRLSFSQDSLDNLRVKDLIEVLLD